MVNVPPIPPLLCSTPPPIDFGEDDEYVDELPPTLDGVVDDDFGDFLTVDDANTNEPLPSPRPPSVCDLPAVSIYDGLIPPPEENLKNNATIPSSPTPPPTPEDNKISKNSKNTTKSINITEAFNFKVKSTYEEESKTLEPKGESNNSSMETKATDDQPNTESLQIETNDLEKLNSQMESLDIIQNPTATPGLSKNVKDLTIETSNNEAKCNSNKTNLNCMQNMVSIEDIEDDLSDDELYSPKTPKNFIETDNLNDYFKIEEIKTTTNTGNLTKVNSKDVDAKSLDSLDNNESASIGNDNDNEFKSFSSNSFMQNNYDMPPPLQDDTNSIDDDDFGDFADFQDFSTSVTPAETQYFVNNTVPVSDINNKQQHNDDLEFNGFNDFNNYNTTRETTNVNTNNEKQEDVEENNTLKDSNAEESDKFEQYTSHSNTLPDSIEERSKQYTLANEIITQEMPQDNNSENINKVSSTVENPSEDFNEENKERSHLDNSFGDFNSATVNKGHDNDEDDFGNFAEFSKPTQNLLRENTEVLKNIEEPKECSPNTTNDEEFDDFADFESHEVNLNTEQTLANEAHTFTNNENHNVPELNDVEEDDDDFGDFNTAQPITPTASSLTLTKTSQNITAATTALPPTHNLNERISKILQLMFTPAITQAADESADELKTDKIQDIPFTSIDAAKALEYQWLNSDTRHSFIRALGIDSRNILFGENWNPSLPRFAANLSFNPLKPMKPVQSSSSAADSNTMLEPIPIISESTKTLDVTGSVKKESFDLDWKPTNTQEQTTEAFKETTVTPVAQSATPITSVPPVTNEPSPAEPVSLTIFENPLENEDKFSKTPPISEMESIPTFSSPLPTNNLDMELEASQNAGSNLDDFVMKDIEDNLKNTLNINEVVVTSTFTGSFKETHIYTPPKTSDFEVKPTTAASTTSSSPSKVSPIDFDYEKAAMGVIINETVVKKEYRDVEYNPPFSMESLSKSVTNKSEMFESNYPNNSNTNNILSAAETDVAVEDEQESSDDFSEFQSVPTEVIMPTTKPVAVNNTKPLEVPKPTTVSHGGMILSPAILIPQAISLEQQKPKIEWGDSTATINPEELARIEELFPEPKSLKSSNGSNSSQKSTPTHQVASTPSISATVANKELEGNLNDDDDDWSDFVSVTVTNNASANRLANNNNILAKSPAGSPFKQRSPVVNHRMPPATHHNNSNNDDEWSDFVSSAPPSQQPASYRVPQFNSGAWQNANFYNNPLSMYHKGPLNVPSTAPATNPTQKILYNNNNNYNISQQPYQITNNLPSLMLGNNQQMQQQPPNNVYQQQIHVMQNFSTAPVPTPERLSAAANAAKNNQFQSIGSAKVAPSIALIPDLGFVAPAIPTHTSFINSLPKPSINTKK